MLDVTQYIILVVGYPLYYLTIRIGEIYILWRKKMYKMNGNWSNNLYIG